MKILSKGMHASFDGMCWTLPSPQLGELAWKARYGSPTREEHLMLASVFECYRELVLMPEKRRREIVRKLREALQLAAESESGE